MIFQPKIWGFSVPVLLPHVGCVHNVGGTFTGTGSWCQRYHWKKKTIEQIILTILAENLCGKIENVAAFWQNQNWWKCVLQQLQRLITCQLCTLYDMVPVLFQCCTTSSFGFNISSWVFVFLCSQFSWSLSIHSHYRLLSLCSSICFFLCNLMSWLRSTIVLSWTCQMYWIESLVNVWCCKRFQVLSTLSLCFGFLVS
jgi:hypothetical protein